jgi:hypothetical protein
MCGASTAAKICADLYIALRNASKVLPMAWSLRNPKIAGYVHDDTETRTGKPKGPMEGCHAVIGKIPHPR